MKLRHLAGTVFIIILVVMIVFLIEKVKSTDAFVDIGRCGVDLPSCVGERVRCINGYCKSDQPVALPELSDLHMIPSTRY